MQHFLRKALMASAAAAVLVSCTSDAVKPDYRQEMRDFIIEISERGEQLHPGFIVVPQNGLALLTDDGTAGGNAVTAYLNAIDGVGQEELFYGYDNQNNFKSQDFEEPRQWLAQCEFATSHNLKVLVTDYCSAPELIADAYTQNDSRGYLSFIANRELDLIPGETHNWHNGNVITLQDAQNFLYVINPPEDKETFLLSLESSYADVLIIDAFTANEMLTTADLARLRDKPNGGTRLVLAYMSIGQAEDYRWYWKPFWTATPPAFLVQEDPYWTGNYYVNYWDPNWQSIICGPNDSYLTRIVNAGFDGVYLDLVNSYEFFED